MTYTITVVSVSDIGLGSLYEAEQKFRAHKKYGPLFREKIKLNLFYLGENRDYQNKLHALEKAVLASDIVLFDMMGTGHFLTDRIDIIVKKYKGDLVLLGYGSEYLRSRSRLGRFALGKMIKTMESRPIPQDKSFDMEKMIKRAETFCKILPFGPIKDMRNMLLMGNYWRYACYKNMDNMLLLLCRVYGKFQQLPRPGDLVDYSMYVLFDPAGQKGFRRLSELKEHWDWDENKQTLGLLFFSFNYPNHTSVVYSQIISRLKKKYNIVPFGISFGKSQLEKIKKILDTGLVLDLVWNFLPFRLGAGPMGGDERLGLAILRRFNCPVMHPFFLSRRDIKNWLEDFQGLNPLELVANLMLPELDGAQDMIPLAGLKSGQKQEWIPDLKELYLINDRFDHLLARSKGYLALRAKANPDKKVAIIFYNNPPCKGKAGQAAFLDTFKSIERITTALKKADYDCEAVTARELAALFIHQEKCNIHDWSTEENIHYSVKEYLRSNRGIIGSEMLEQISAVWGGPPGEIMADKDSFLIPGIIRQNIFIGVQPSMDIPFNGEKPYHDKQRPPHHQYLAFYQWLENEFKADVVIHAGTHGTLEFLPGKESGLSQKCYPDYLMGGMPHLYICYSGNPSGATIARRRSHACLISYSGAPFKRADSYGGYLELESLLAEYLEASQLFPKRQEKLFETIKKKAAALKLDSKDVFSIDTLTKELIRFKNSLIPAGLHEFGRSFDQKEKICFLLAILSWKRNKIVSLKDLVANAFNGLKFDGLDTKGMPPLKKDDHIWSLLRDLIEDYFFGEKNIYRLFREQLSRNDQRKLLSSMKFGEKCLKRLDSTNEIAGLLNALDGNYIEARLGGDLIRDPDILPTGYNICQFDARLVPSDTAIKRGKEIAVNTMDFYFKQEGKYPESVSVVLWGFETSQTKGETIGQILYYLGVKILPAFDVMEKKFEIIPLKELKRPRIDCLITICGFFRDMFPMLIDFLDEIYEAVSLLDEPVEINFIRKHSQAIFDELKQEIKPDQGWGLASARIFGPPEGGYGTGITSMIGESSWRKESEIIDSYLASQRHIYTRTRRGQSQKEIFEANLKKVDILSQVRNTADYSIIDLNHYYEFFGGLSKAIENIKGAKPLMLVTDSTASAIYTDDARKAIEIGVRTRLLNPKYFNDILKHKVHGAQHIARQMENLIGLAATTKQVGTWIFEEVKDTYLDNQRIFSLLKENNQFAAMDIIKRLLEAEKRGYWQAKEEDLEQVTKLYSDLEANMEERTSRA